MRLAVLVSGSGTLLGAMLAAGLNIDLVLSDRPCKGIEVANESKVASVVVERKDFASGFDRASYDQRLLAELEQHQVDLVAMAGFGTILGETFFNQFGGTVLNTHPALLPSFPGWHAVRDALSYGVKVTGCSIHVATPVVDAGPIVAQEAVRVLPSDDESSLHERIKAVERPLYVETLRTILETGTVGIDVEPDLAKDQQ